MSEVKDKYQFINSFYIREKNNNGEAIPDALIVIYKVNGDQRIQIINEPNFSFYIAKPDVVIKHNLDNIELSKCDKVTIKYKDLKNFLLEYNNKKEEYNNILYKRLDNIQKRTLTNDIINKCQANPRIFGSDVNINDYYKMEFVKKYGVEIGGYKKGVFDIETDGISNQTMVKYPINCLSYYDFNTDTMYGLYWDQKGRWPRYDEFKQDALSGKFEQVLRSDPEMNGEFEKQNNLSEKKTIKNTKFVFEFYEDEFDLIRRFFQLIHENSPDYAMAWNYTFDLLYMINRLIKHIDNRKLNIRLEDIICDPNIPSKFRYYKYLEDKSDRGHYYEKWHWFEIPGKTTYIDAMATYADIRKTAGTLPSYALNDICIKELNKGKIDYHGIADNAAELPYKDFYLHAHYNIRDTFLLAEIEFKNNDIDALMYKGQCTRLQKVTRQTSTLKNYQHLFYFRNGLAIGNNINNFIKQPSIPYSGALVAREENNEPIITPLFNYPSRVIRPFVNDNDLTSMYPSMSMAHNIYKTTLEFHITKIGDIKYDQIVDNNNMGTISVNEAFDNIQANNFIRWSHDYLQLPNFDDLFTGLQKELIDIDKTLKE